jgi:hypothetical protein
MGLVARLRGDERRLVLASISKEAETAKAEDHHDPRRRLGDGRNVNRIEQRVLCRVRARDEVEVQRIASRGGCAERIAVCAPSSDRHVLTATVIRQRENV